MHVKVLLWLILFINNFISKVSCWPSSSYVLVHVIISPTCQFGSGEKVNDKDVPAALAIPSVSVKVEFVALLIITVEVPVPTPPLVELDITNVGMLIGANLADVICSSKKLLAEDKLLGNIFCPVYFVCVVKLSAQPDLKTSISIFLGSDLSSVQNNIPSNTLIPVIY